MKNEKLKSPELFEWGFVWVRSEHISRNKWESVSKGMVLPAGAEAAWRQVKWCSPCTLGEVLPLIVNSNNTQGTRWEQLFIQEFKKAIKSEFPKKIFGKLTISSDMNILLPQCVYTYKQTHNGGNNCSPDSVRDHLSRLRNLYLPCTPVNSAL